MESFANEKCALCKEEFETNPTSVQQKVYETLLRISRDRSMLKLTNDLINRKDSGQQILVHFDCRKFTDTTKKSQSNQPSKKLRSSFDNAFNWKQHCFICAKPADTRHTNKSNIIKVMILPLRDTLVVCAKERNDDRGESVLGRLERCNDLVAEEAVYHATFMTKFRLTRSSDNSKGKHMDKVLLESFEMFVSGLKLKVTATYILLKNYSKR